MHHSFGAFSFSPQPIWVVCPVLYCMWPWLGRLDMLNICCFEQPDSCVRVPGTLRTPSCILAAAPLTYGRVSQRWKKKRNPALLVYTLLIFRKPGIALFAAIFFGRDPILNDYWIRSSERFSVVLGEPFSMGFSSFRFAQFSNVTKTISLCCKLSMFVTLKHKVNRFS